eukprot:359083-Chlamydomonas_euryale.AAC.5
MPRGAQSVIDRRHSVEDITQQKRNPKITCHVFRSGGPQPAPEQPCRVVRSGGPYLYPVRRSGSSPCPIIHATHSGCARGPPGRLTCSSTIH